MVATAILVTITTAGTTLLWDTLSTRAKQGTIENSADNFRLLVATLTKAIQTAKIVEIVNPNRIEITASNPAQEPCRTIKLNGKVIEQAIDQSLPSCTPPDDSTVYSPLTKPELEIKSLVFSSPSNPAKVVTIKIEGIYKDNLGDHPVSFQTSIAPRLSL